MILKEIVSFLDSEIPLAYQEGYDNSGLQVGSFEMEIRNVLLALDATESVLDEAIRCKCDLIVTHHPPIFSGLKNITGQTSSGRIVIKAIANNVAIYSAHTNLDAMYGGVSMKMAEKLQLKNIRVLSPHSNMLQKLVTYVPESHLATVRDAVFKAGAGVIGKYDRCGFTVEGSGSFRGDESTQPFSGIKGVESVEKEIRFETVLFSHNSSRVVNALIENHPYEEVAYDLYPLVNKNVRIGMGAIGDLEQKIEENSFLRLVAEIFNARGIRYSLPTGNKIGKVALCGGAGSSLLNAAIEAGADAFITADIKYHSYSDSENRILLIDAGHFETEKFSTEILYDLIIKKIPKFAVRFSETNTNPINYL